MDRVGGYASYAAMLADDRRMYEDVLLAIEGEAEAERIRRMRLEQEARSGQRR